VQARQRRAGHRGVRGPVGCSRNNARWPPARERDNVSYADDALRWHHHARRSTSRGLTTRLESWWRQNPMDVVRIVRELRLVRLPVPVVPQTCGRPLRVIRKRQAAARPRSRAF
jgi:hypothetical protein